MLHAVPAERALALLSFFSELRTDERVRIANRLKVLELEPGQVFSLEAGQPALVLVLGGEVLFERPGTPAMRLFPGDTFGAAEVISGTCLAAKLTGTKASRLAVIDRALFDALLAEFPVIALPLVSELGRELKWRNDLLREVVLARAQKLPERQLESLLRGRRARLMRHRLHAPRRLGQVLLHVLVTEPSRRPSFWVFLGASLALISARTVVGYILKNGLQSRLFALIGGTGGYHPIHVHHFNYGLVLVSLTGLLSMVPGVRRALRFLAFLFGFGMGLIVDEFALLWNLDPDYYQPSSRIVAALVLFVLFQLVYFRGFYASLGRRLLPRERAQP